MPDTPTTIIPAPSGSAPSSPASVVAAPSGSAPSSPASVVAAPSGSAPSAPGVVVAAYSPPVDVPAVPNFLETNFPGSNNDLRFEQAGVQTPTIQFQTNGNFASDVVVTGNAINIRVQFLLGICQLSGATAKALIEASAAAMALVTVSNKAGNDGSGQLTTDSSIPFGPTALSGGSPAVPGVMPPGSIV